MVFSFVPGTSCTTTFTHSPTPLSLPTKSGSQSTLPDLCKEVVPPCTLNPLLFNGHLQTAWTAVKAEGPPIHYRRRVFEQEDKNFTGHFAVDFVTRPDPTDGKAAEESTDDAAGLLEDPTGVGHHHLPPRTRYFSDSAFESLASEKSTKPLLICLHGLSGGSHEIYLRHVLAPLVAGTAAGADADGLSGGDWEALVVNSRGCAGSKITSSILYNARATWDVRQAVAWARRTWPNRPLFGVGFSLGANILTNYIAEEGATCALRAAVIVSNPWKLEVSSLALQRTWLGLEIYSKTMGDSMRALYSTHKAEIAANTALNPARIAQIKYLHEFDREVQCATWGYPTEGAYYRDASSADAVMAIRVPVLCLHARDDPIVCDEAVPYEEIRQNPFVVMCATSGGGHLSWFEVGGGRWHAKPTVNFLNKMAREVELSKIEAPEPAVKGPHGGHQTPFVFEPTRHKHFVPGGQQ